MVYRKCYEIQVGPYAGSCGRGDPLLTGCAWEKTGTKTVHVLRHLVYCPFILICGFVMLNLVIAVILDLQSYSGNVDLPSARRTALRSGVGTDRHGFLAIAVDKLLRRLSAPLGVKNLPKA